jgi:hypothetical protein
VVGRATAGVVSVYRRLGERRGRTTLTALGEIPEILAKYLIK